VPFQFVLLIPQNICNSRCTASFVDTGGKLTASVIDTNGKFTAGVFTGGHIFPQIYGDNGSKFSTGVSNASGQLKNLEPFSQVQKLESIYLIL
jgi:hypothetical protein